MRTYQLDILSTKNDKLVLVAVKTILCMPCLQFLFLVLKMHLVDAEVCLSFMANSTLHGELVDQTIAVQRDFTHRAAPEYLLRPTLCSVPVPGPS